jgi:hypothetical protein
MLAACRAFAPMRFNPSTVRVSFDRLLFDAAGKGRQGRGGARSRAEGFFHLIQPTLKRAEGLVDPPDFLIQGQLI